MSKVRRIREDIDTNLEKWEAWASAVEAQLNLTIEQAFDKLNEKKLKLKNPLEQLEQIIQESTSIDETQKNQLLIELDHLKIQLAVQRLKDEAKARRINEEDRKKIEKSISSIETNFDENIEIIDDSMHQILKSFFKEANELNAEFQAIDIRLDEGIDDISEKIDIKKSDLEAKIKVFKEDLKKKREQSEENGESANAKLSEAKNQILGAFKDLFS